MLLLLFTKSSNKKATLILVSAQASGATLWAVSVSNNLSKTATLPRPHQPQPLAQAGGLAYFG